MMLEHTLGPLLRADVEAGTASGVAVAVSRATGHVEQLVVGADGAGRPLAADSLYPVASITKLAVALAVLRLADAGELAPEDELARHLPEAAAAVPGVTLRTLMTHTAGLPIELPDGAAPYTLELDWPALASACLRIALERSPATGFRYGNIGYGLLGVVVERATGRPMPAAIDELVFRPLGMEAYLGAEPPRRPAVVAGVGGPHEGTPLEALNSAFWRSLALPWGGVVTTAHGALALVRAFAGEPAGYLRPETMAAATRDQTDGVPTPPGSAFDFLGSPWGLGPELRGPRSAWAPAEAGPSSFGHGGASGCLAWLAPESGVAWAVLTSRALGAPDHWLFTRAADVGRAILARGTLERQ